MISTRSKSHFFRRISGKFIITLLLVIIIFYKILSKGLLLSPDSLIYIDSALNIMNGRGCVHSFVFTGDFDMWDGKKFIPVGYWSPGYPYFLAIIIKIFDLSNGLSVELAQGFLLWVTILLIAVLPFYEDKHSRELSLGICLLTFPLTYIFSWVWSEGINTVLITLFLYWCIKGIREKMLSWWFAVGVCAGIAFWIRYVSVTLILFSMFIFLIEFLWNIVKGFWTNNFNPNELFSYCKIFILKEFLLIAGWGIFAIPLFLRNYFFTGSILGYPREYTHTSLLENLRYVMNIFFYSWFDEKLIPKELQSTIILTLFLLGLLLIVVRRKYIDVLNWIVRKESLVLLFWSLFYVAFISVYASIYNIDTIGIRLLSPAILALIILIGALISILCPVPKSASIIFWLLGLLVFSGSYPYVSDNSFPLRDLSKKERINWVCKNTTINDMILGDSTFDFAIFCGDRRSVCFVPGSKKDTPPDYEMIKNLLNISREWNGKLYIVLRKALPLDRHFRLDWQDWFGKVIAELIFDKTFEDLKVKKFEKGKDFVALEVDIEEGI